MDSMLSLGKVLDGPIQESMGSLKETIDKLSKIPLFGTERSLELAQYSTKIAEANQQYNEQIKKVKELEQALNTLNSSDIAKPIVYGGKLTERNEYTQQKAELTAQIAAAKKTMASAQTQAESIALKVKN